MNLRAAALERLEQLYHGDHYSTGMMQAILIGSSFQLQRVWTEQFRSTGNLSRHRHLGHSHRGAIRLPAADAAAVFRARRESPAGIDPRRHLALHLVTGWQPPCVRSAAGFTLFMIGRFFYRERRIMNLLAAVAIGFLLLDPEQMFEPSFQLSFLAVGFIGAFATPLLGGHHRAPGRGHWAAWTTSGAIFTCRRGWRSFGWKCACWPKRFACPRDCLPAPPAYW